jgi:preprotein translocase subunit SecD
VNKLKRQLFLLLLLLSTSLACAAVGKYLPPQVTILAAPAESVKWDAASLQKAGEIIDERLKEKVTGKYAVKTTEKNQISVELYNAQDLDIAQKVITEPGAILFIDSLDVYSVGAEAKIDEKTKIILTQEDIQSADVSPSQVGDQYQISFTLNSAGTKNLADYTGESENIGHFLAILRDGIVVSCPRVYGEIAGGKGVITGAFTQQEAEELAALMTHPPLPFQLIVTKVTGWQITATPAK